MLFIYKQRKLGRVHGKCNTHAHKAHTRVHTHAHTHTHTHTLTHSLTHNINTEDMDHNDVYTAQEALTTLV